MAPHAELALHMQKWALCEKVHFQGFIQWGEAFAPKEREGERGHVYTLLAH